MMRIRQILKPPVYADEKSSRQSMILHIILWSLLILAVIYLVFSLVFSPYTAAEDAVIAGVGIAANIILLILLHRGYLRLAAILQVAIFWSEFTVIAFALNGVSGPAYMMGYILVILIAGILLEGRGALVMTVLSLLSGLVLVYFQKNNLLVFHTIPRVESYWIVSAFMFPMCAVLQFLAAQSLRRALARSSESEAKYRNILDLIQDAYYRCDLEGRLVMVSPSFLKLFGHSSMDEVLGQNIAGRYYLNPADREKFLLAVETAQEVRNYEEMVKRKDGSLLTVSTTSHYVLDGKGGKIGIEGIIRDVTEIKRIEIQRRESEAAYHILFEESPLAAVVIDFSGMCVDANSSFCKLIGVARSDVLNKLALEIGGLSDVERRTIFEAGEKKKGHLDQHEAVLRHVDGHIIHGIVSTKPIIYHSHPHILIIINDITRRVEAEHELKESENRYRSLSDATMEGVMVQKDGVILDANRKFAEIFGYEHPEELIGKNGYDILLTPESSMVAIDPARQNPESVFEVNGVRKDGTIFPGETQSRAINFRGKNARVVSMRDISQRKNAEAELHRLNRALRTISKCNEALVRSGNEEELLREICKTIVNVGEYQTASIVLVRTDGENRLRPFFSFTYPLENPGAAPSHYWDQYTAALTALVQERLPVFLNRHTEREQYAVIGRLPDAFPSLAILPLHYERSILGVLLIFGAREDAFDQDEIMLISDMAADLSYGLHTQIVRQERRRFLERLEITNQELEFSYDATLEGWSSALELRERETGGHSQRVVELTMNIAREMGIPEADLRHIRMGALLHDIGKMGIPDAILLKPGPLTEDEWITMRQHPIYAYKLLKGIPHLQRALEIPHFHHEHWDGQGYPNHLKAENIPLVARIFALVDVWDALTSDRPYRQAWSHESALAYIRDQSGKQFDPEIVNIFLQMIAP